jgi:hypothetical protein
MMTAPHASATDKTWARIEEEKRRDRFLRRVGTIARATTFVILLGYGILTAWQVWEMYRAYLIGTMPIMTVVGMITPLIIVLGVVSLLIALVATIGVFLRLRTASLNEIQLRLAALEELLSK